MKKRSRVVTVSLLVTAIAGLVGIANSPTLGGASAEALLRAKRSPIGYQPELLVQFRVSDLDRSLRFYQDSLDFDLVERNDELRWAKVSFGMDNVRVGLGVGPEVKGSGTTSLNVTVKDVEKARNVLESRGVKFPKPTIVIPGVVKLADFTDPDGNKIRLAQGLSEEAN